MDATDNELVEIQYYGCCVVDLYNYERTHRGYRLNGRTPATVFHGAVAA